MEDLNMYVDGYFELKGSVDFVLEKMCSKMLKTNGVVYFADFGDGTIKVGMSRGPKSRVNGFEKTAISYGKGDVIKFGISPIISNQVEVERNLHNLLSDCHVERELFRVSESEVERVVKLVKMNVLRSCMWPACTGYFNHYGKKSVRPA